jgi:fatty-acyl-CoA synthase
VQVRVVDSELRDLPPGEVGAILYQDPPVLREYWHNPEATAEAFSGGWFHSGDLGPSTRTASSLSSAGSRT